MARHKMRGRNRRTQSRSPCPTMSQTETTPYIAPSPPDGVTTPPDLPSHEVHFMSGALGPPSTSEQDDEPSQTPAAIEGEVFAVDTSMLDIDDHVATTRPAPHAIGLHRMGFVFEMVTRSIPTLPSVPALPTLPTMPTLPRWRTSRPRVFGRLATYRPFAVVINKVTSYWRRDEIAQPPIQQATPTRVAAVPVNKAGSAKRIFLDVSVSSEAPPSPMPGAWPEPPTAATDTPDASDVLLEEPEHEGPPHEVCHACRRCLIIRRSFFPGEPALLFIGLDENGEFCWRCPDNPLARRILGARYPISESGRIDYDRKKKIPHPPSQRLKRSKQRRALPASPRLFPLNLPQLQSERANKDTAMQEATLDATASQSIANQRESPGTPASAGNKSQVCSPSPLVADGDEVYCSTPFAINENNDHSNIPTTPCPPGAKGKQPQLAGPQGEQIQLAIPDDEEDNFAIPGSFVTNGDDQIPATGSPVANEASAFDQSAAIPSAQGNVGQQLIPPPATDLDMSTLEDAPDAPPRKTVTFAENAFLPNPENPFEHGVLEHMRYLYKDLAITEQAENHFRNVKPRSETDEPKEDLETAISFVFSDREGSPTPFDTLIDQSPEKVDDPDDSILLRNVTEDMHHWDLGGVQVKMNKKKQEAKDKKEQEERERLQQEEDKRVAAELARREAEEAEKQKIAAEAARLEKEVARKAKEASRLIIFKISQEAAASIDSAAKKGPDATHALYLKGSNLSTLLPHKFRAKPGTTSANWLDDLIVNEYLKLLTEWGQKSEDWRKAAGRGPPIHAFPSQWWLNVTNERKKNPAKEFDLVKRWHSRAGLAGRRILDSKLILFPICEGSHWRLLAVRPQEKQLEFLDSLLPDLGTQTRYVDVARRFLKSELGAAYVAEEWTMVPNRSGMQDNTDDCGVFTCFNAMALMRDEVPGETVTADLMRFAREQLAATLLAGGFIGEFEL